MSAFGLNEQIEREDLGGGVSRKILTYGGNVMMVEVTMKKGGMGSVHTHPHEQISYIAAGSFEFDVDGVKQVVKKGDSLYVSPNVPHGTLSLEEGSIIVDVFCPIREDFLKK